MCSNELHLPVYQVPLLNSAIPCLIYKEDHNTQ